MSGDIGVGLTLKNYKQYTVVMKWKCYNSGLAEESVRIRPTAEEINFGKDNGYYVSRKIRTRASGIWEVEVGLTTQLRGSQ